MGTQFALKGSAHFKMAEQKLSTKGNEVKVLIFELKVVLT